MPKDCAVPHEVVWSRPAHDDIAELFDYVAEHESIRDANHLCDRLLTATEHLARFPRLYEAAPEYGAGVRRISLMGHHVLYAIDDPAQRVTVLAVVSQRQNPHPIR